MTELVTFGEIMLRLSPPAGERLETTRAFNYNTAGAESNVAVAASRLEASVTWLSRLPDSPLGQRVTTEPQQHGVTPEVVWSNERRQGVYDIEHRKDPRPTNVTYG